jgi:hypothetical protein
MARSQGRGWHGDREGHARAGRLGGRARGRKRNRGGSNSGNNR